MAHDAVIIAVKGLLGGLLVSGFALLGQVLRPKWFAGLFGAAPSIALASLIVTFLDRGHHDASLAAFGMVFGALGFVGFGLASRPLLLRWHAVLASTAGCLVWVGIAFATYGLATQR
jgi:hypothetical protein